jgi:hypothetical protein
MFNNLNFWTVKHLKNLKINIMKQKMLTLLSLFLLISIGSVQLNAQAELVNYEETWQKFLKEPLTSAVSKLTKPEKSNSSDYLKYCLMYATSYFCADNLKDAQEMMAEIKKVGLVEYSKIPGYKERFDDLGKKIEAYYQWVNFGQHSLPIKMSD